MIEDQNATVPRDVPDLDRQVFELQNKLRADPRSFIPYLQEMLSRFDGDLLKQPGKTTLRTKEGPSAVNEAIEYLGRTESARQLRWSGELCKAARDHVVDTGPKGLVQHESSDGTSVKERLKRYGKIVTCYGENLSFHCESAIDVIL